ncbi:hypothetical protein BGX33_009452, partial [Mortierella sp. NVP41]
ASLQAIMDHDRITANEKVGEGQSSTTAALDTATEELSLATIQSTRTTTMARYVDSMTNYDGQIWYAYATGCLTGKSQSHLISKLALHMQTRLVEPTAERLTFMVLLPGFIRDLIPLAHRLRSLVRLRLSGNYDSDELGYVISFLSARQKSRDVGTGKKGSSGSRTGSNNSKDNRVVTIVRGIEEFNMPQVINTSSHHQNHTPLPPPGMKDFLLQQIRLQQLDILVLSGQPVSLDANSCSDFSKVSHQIPCYTLQRLKSLKHVHGFLEGDAERFLRRCRGLQELDFASFHRDVFSWAVNEKQQRILSQQSSSQPQPQIQPTAPTTTGMPPFSSDLVRLKKVRLAASQWLVGRMMQSVTFAFSHSLEYLLFNVYDHTLLRNVLCGHTVARLEANATPDKPFLIDHHSFRMPRLRKLRLLRVNSGVMFGPDPFEGCPLLESLSISGSIGFMTPSGHFEVLRIPLLKRLELGRGTAAHFRIESLQFSPLLESLALVDNVPARLPLPGTVGDIFNIDYTPISTLQWSWTMDHLATIHLAGPSAFNFRFEWLRRCPTLGSLTVDGLLPSALNPDPQDLAIGPANCGQHLQSCELVIYNRQQYSQSSIATVLETYCPKVERLKLIGRVNDTTDSKEWTHLDLGIALFASRNLPLLRTLVARIGSGPSIETLVERYSLVCGTVQPTRHAVVWCPSIPLRRFHIEFKDIRSGCAFFRQRSSWQFLAEANEVSTSENK